MSEFERDLPSYRLVEIHHGDDLQAIATRELGDANRWPEIAFLNNLTPPYVTTDARLAGPSVLLAGSLIKVPAPRGVYTDAAERGQVYERDCALSNKLLEPDESGDLSVVAGVDNLRQQLSHRINTPMGQARRHPVYGCRIWSLLGKAGGPVGAKLGAGYVKSALLSDYRVARVTSARAEVIGDAVRILARAEAIEGSAVDLRAGNSE